MEHVNKQPKILLVDDNEDNLDLLCIQLDKLNVKLIRANSGSEALNKTNGIELALAIVDVQMPIMTGYEMTVKLNEGRQENKVPIIFLTAIHPHQKELLQGYSYGAVDYIIKPFPKQILLSKVNIFLDLFNQKRIIKRNSELLIKSLEDIVKANEQLKEREQNLLKEQLFNKTLLDSMPGIFYLYTYPELKMIGWNKQHETIFGYQPEEMLGRHILEWHLPENKTTVMDSLKNFTNVGTASVETPLLTKNKQPIPFSLNAVKFESEGLSYLLGVGTNISERKQAEEALRDSESSLTKAQEIAHVGSWEYNYNSDKMKCSDETLRIFGFEPGSVEPSLDLFYGMVNPEDYFLLKEDINKAFDLHIPLSIDLRIVHNNGEERVIHEQAEMTFNAIGIPIKMAGTVHDITHRKLIERELQKSLEQLQQLSKHIGKAIENERLTIARDLHDDLGQALTAVKIDLEIIKQQASETIIKEKIQNVKALVGDTIRTVQRITSQLRPEIIDDLGLEAAIDWYTKEFSKRYGIKIFLNIDNEIPISTEEALPLFRIVQESLTNIARHAQATHVEILLNKEGDSIVFVIADNGVGITDEQIKSKKSFGIMSMKERVDALGGKFTISRGDKYGSKIIINFPITKMSI